MRAPLSLQVIVLFPLHEKKLLRPPLVPYYVTPGSKFVSMLNEVDRRAETAELLFFHIFCGDRGHLS